MGRDKHSAADTVIRTPDALPRPIGPFPQAVRAGDFVFVSGTVAVDPTTGEVVEGGIEEQTAYAMGNIRSVLEAAGGSMNDLVKVTVHLRDVQQDWHRMNAVYESFFDGYLPARMSIQAQPPLGFLVDIDATAYLPGG